MNIRFSEGSVRCRVTQGELDTLLSSRAVELALALPRNHTLRVNVKPGMIGGWRLDSDPTGVWITIPRSDLEALAQTLPSREGIEHRFELAGGGTVTVSFEVDVRKRSAGAQERSSQAGVEAGHQ